MKIGTTGVCDSDVYQRGSKIYLSTYFINVDWVWLYLLTMIIILLISIL